MRTLFIAASALLLSSCDSASAPEQTPQLATSAADSLSARVAGAPTPVASAEPRRNMWMADIRAEEAMLYFGYPHSDYIAFKMRCVSGSGHASIAVPSFGNAILALSSEGDSETFPSRIVSGADGYEDQVETLQDAALDHPVWRRFLRTGRRLPVPPVISPRRPTKRKQRSIASSLHAMRRGPPTAHCPSPISRRRPSGAV